MSTTEENYSPSIFALVSLVLFGLLLAIVAVEGVVRIFDFDVPKELPWQDRPSTYFIPEGALTMQDFPHSTTKPKGTIRIAVVGDSFSFAPYMQFDDTFAKRLERWFNLNQHQPRVEVINYGVPRYSTSHEIAVVEQAIKEGADLVLLQITLNDPEIKPYRPTGLIESDRFGRPAPKGFIVDHWRTLKFILTRLANAKSTNDYRDYFFKLFEDQDTYSNFKNSLTKIRDLTKESKTPIRAVVFPLFGFPNDERYPFHPIHQKVANLLLELEISELDLFDTFKNIPLDRMVVLPGKDRHPNEIAHRLAAESIYLWLKREEVLPPAIFAKKSSPERTSILLPSQSPTTTKN
jgi:lysophospholipase L1-like esterase